MKRILILAAIFVMTGTMAMASNDRAVTFAQLPQKAQQFIKTHFANSKISYAKQDTGMFDGDYEVIFTDGNKIEFLKKGEWKEVDCKRTVVPAGVVPPRIKTFVTQNHPDAKIVKIDRDSRDYELKLSDGVELKFNLKGDFLHYDH